ncbi:MAG: DNA alkylation repair protein [Candidatus Woesearchaeota archaeon]
MIYLQLKKLQKEIKENSSKEKAEIYQRFFKTGIGEYGEGDVFLGLIVPEQRKISKKYISLDLNDVSILVSSKYHEYRLIGFLILLEKYKLAKIKDEKKELLKFFLKYVDYLNNWDLVDVIAPKIFGDYFFNYSKNEKIFFEFVESENLWHRRIAIISTIYFIKKKKFDLTLKISKLLLNDKHDLIHKAVGWMLREVGKIDFDVELKFLKKYYTFMPRTMLRYAIERFDEKLRQDFLKGNV